MENVKNKVDKAHALLSGLSEEKIRWRVSL